VESLFPNLNLFSRLICDIVYPIYKSKNDYKAEDIEMQRRSVFVISIIYDMRWILSYSFDIYAKKFTNLLLFVPDKRIYEYYVLF